MKKWFACFAMVLASAMSSTPAHACPARQYLFESSERASKAIPNSSWVNAKLLRGLVIRSEIKDGRMIPILAIEVELINDFGHYRKGEFVRIVNPDSHCVDLAAPEAIKNGVIDGFSQLQNSTLPGFLMSNFRSNRNLTSIVNRGDEAEWVKMSLGTYD